MATLREVMSPDPVTTDPDATVAEAAHVMVRGRFGSVLVSEDGSIVGILTERDVLRAAGSEGNLLGTEVRDWMTRDPQTAPADMDTEEAIAELLVNGFRHLPVTEGGDVIGIVSLRDLLRRHSSGGAPRAADAAGGDAGAPGAATGSTTAAGADATASAHASDAETAAHDMETATHDAEIAARDAETAAHDGGAGATGEVGDGVDGDDVTPEPTPPPVQERRERMFEATRLLQQCSQPPEGDVDAWRSELRAAIDQIDEVVTEHIAGTEDTDGFFDELVRESGGRLQAAVRRLHRDHERSTELVRKMRAALDADTEPAELQRLGAALFAQLEAHRHRGADLLWQAYGVEIGGGD